MIEIKSDTREAKLPGWARHLLQVLRNRLQEQEDYLELARKEVKEATGRISVKRYSLEHEPWPLPDRCIIRFTIDKDRRNHIDVRLTDDGKGIYIMSDRAIALHPSVSNTIEIKPRND